MQRLINNTKPAINRIATSSLHQQLPSSSTVIPTIQQHAIAQHQQQPHRPYTTSPVGGHDFVQSARSLEESHQLVLRLYKKIIRSLPVMIRQFECEGQGIMQASTMNIRSKFEHHSDITDLPILDLLRHKGEIEWYVFAAASSSEELVKAAVRHRLTRGTFANSMHPY